MFLKLHMIKLGEPQSLTSAEVSTNVLMGQMTVLPPEVRK
jgi:hypothetical protein